MKKSFILLLSSLIFANCTPIEKIFFKSIITIYPSSRHSIKFEDGYQGAYYTFTLGDKNNIDTYLFAAQGSGYASVQYFRFYFKDLPGNIKVFALQKRYVRHNDSHVDKPVKQFHQYYCLSQIITDQVEFIHSILLNQDITHKKIVMFGVSEGAMVASAVAAQIPEITHLAVLGDGGMKGIDSFRIWGQRTGNDFDKIYEIVSNNPTIDQFIGQYTHKYWKDMLNEDPMKHLIHLSIPMFYCMGEKDESVPIESLYYLQKQFKELGKENLTTKIYPNCSHDLEDSKGNSHRSEFMNDIHEWLNCN